MNYFKLHEEYNNSLLSKWFKDSVVVDENNKPLTVYHGSPSDFNIFDFKHIGKTGTTEGYGIYFTDNKETASRYAESKLYSVYLSIQKPLSYNTITITRSELAKLIKALDKKGDDFLSEFEDVNFLGYNKVLNIALNSLFKYNDNDVDIIHDIMNTMGGYHAMERVYPILKKVLGYDGIVVEKDYDVAETHYVVFHPNQIKSIENDGSWDLDDNNIYS